jgi:hypothetical protein
MENFDIRTEKWMCTTPLDDHEMATLVFTILEKAGITVHPAVKAYDNYAYSDNEWSNFIFIDDQNTYVNSAYTPYFNHQKMIMEGHYRIELKDLLEEARKIIENERI